MISRRGLVRSGNAHARGLSTGAVQAGRTWTCSCRPGPNKYVTEVVLVVGPWGSDE